MLFPFRVMKISIREQCDFGFVALKFPWVSNAVSVLCHENFHGGAMRFPFRVMKISIGERCYFHFVS